MFTSATNLLGALALATAATASLSNGHDAAHHHHAHIRAQQLADRATNKGKTMPSGWSLEAQCIKDSQSKDKSTKLLAHSSNFETTLTPAQCANYCNDQGYSIAGVQFGIECWCGDELNECEGAGDDAAESECNYPCAGDKSQMCGGDYHLTVYSKGGANNSTGGGSGDKDGGLELPTNVTVPDSKYKLKKDMSGAQFFSAFNFFTDRDPTNGHVNYLSNKDATSKGLAYVDSKSNQAIIRVDNKNWLKDGAFRDSIRINSKDTYSKGLVLFDIAQMPYGCSVWPAIWTVGKNWPNGGEIDILEGVNNITVNQQTLHTGSGTSCSTSRLDDDAVSSSKMNKQCASSDGANAGCGFQDQRDGAYGAAFNKQGGVVYALLMEDTGITVWTFRRDEIPADVTAGKPNPASWSKVKPTASWPSASGCKTTDVIKEQTLVLDITLCGDWAKDSFSSNGCPGSCYDMIKDPKNYDNAIFKINSIKHFQM